MQVIVPNLTMREVDQEVFEDDPEEYIRRDIEGSGAYGLFTPDCNDRYTLQILTLVDVRPATWCADCAHTGSSRSPRSARHTSARYWATTAATPRPSGTARTRPFFLSSRWWVVREACIRLLPKSLLHSRSKARWSRRAPQNSTNSSTLAISSAATSYPSYRSLINGTLRYLPSYKRAGSRHRLKRSCARRLHQVHHDVPLAGA